MHERPDPSARPRAAEAGFSLLETLIAAALLLFILIGVLPLFERSRLNLMQGNDASSVANAAMDATDELFGIDFNSQATNVVAGTELQATDFWLLEGNRWVLDMTPYAADRAQFTRTTTIEQFAIDDLRDDGTLDDPLPAATLPGFIQVKRITTSTVNARTALAGAPSTYRVITLKFK